MTKPTFEQMWNQTPPPSFEEMWGRTDTNQMSGRDVFRISKTTGADVGLVARIGEAMYRTTIGIGSGSAAAASMSPEDQERAIVDVANAVKETPENLYIGGLMFSEGILDAMKWNADIVQKMMEAVPGAELTPAGQLAESVVAGGGIADNGATWLRNKAQARIDAQMKVTLANAPITRMARAVMQEGVPSAAVAVGLSLLTGSPYAGLTAFFASTGGQEYQQQREAGASLPKATFLATLSASAEVGGEMLVLPKFIKGLTRGIPLRNVATLIAENYGQEFATGWTQSMVHNVGVKTSAGMSLTEAVTSSLDDAWEDAKASGNVGAGTALFLSAATIPASYYRKASELQANGGGNVAVQTPAKPQAVAPAVAPAASVAQPAVVAPSPQEVTPATPTPAETLWQRLTGPEKFVPANDAEKELAEAYQVGILGSAQDVEQWMGTTPAPTVEGAPKPEPLPVPVAPVAGQGVPYEPGVETGRVRERKFVTSLKAVGILPKEATAEYRQRNTEALAIKAANLVREDPDRAESIARTKVNDTGVAVTVELLKDLNRQRAVATDESTRKVLTDKINNLIETTAAKYTEAGRTIQALSILGMQTPEGQLRFAAKTIAKYNEKHALHKIPNLTDDQTNYILDEMQAIGRMPDGPEKGIRYKKLQDYIGALTPSTFYQKAVALWKAGLMSGLKTIGLTGINVVSNLSHGVSEIAKDPFTVAADSMFSVFTGERTTALTTTGTVEGFKEGLQKGWTYFRTGYGERDFALRWDMKKVNFGKSKVAKWLQRYEEFVFRVAGAEDYPFYYSAKARSIAGQAVAKARKEKLSGKAFDARVNDLIANPSDDMLRYAVIDAETAVFANKTMLGDIARTIQKVPGGQIVIPFGRTPSAMAMQILNYTPVGAVKAIVENINNFDQRTLSEALGRAGMGTAVLWVGGQLFAAGVMTLKRPEGEKEKELWKLEGRAPNSIKIGGKWRQAQVLGPLGIVLLIGGYFEQALQDTGSPTRAITTGLSGGAASFSDQTFVRGLNMAIDALQDPERSFDTFVSSMAGSTVPTIVADMARASDSVERRTSGPLERIASRVPVARQTLQPDLTVFGQDLPRYGGNVLEVMADPTRPSKINQDMVVDELRRLWDAGHKPSPTKLGDRTGYKCLTPSQNTELWRRAGEMTYAAIWEVMSDPLYAEADDEDKARYIDRVTENAKITARAEMAYSLVDGLSPEKREAEVKRLRDGGLVVNAVERVLISLY